MVNSSESLSKKTHLDYLDGLKGIAILMVLFFHVSLDFQNNFFFINFKEKVEHLSRGVQLFFIVSGFSLFHSSSLWNLYKHPKLTFYLKRFFRILPLWWLIVILYHYFWAMPHSMSDFFATMFLYFGFSQNAWSIAIVPVAWSLFVEESFYVFFPVWKKYIFNWKIAFTALVASYLLAILWYSKAPLIFHGQHFIGIHPIGNYYAFFLGILLFHLNKSFQLDKIKCLNSFFVQFINVSCLVAIYSIFKYDRMTGTLALGTFVISAFFEETIFGKIVRSRFIRPFGVCCYSIYIFHAPVLIVLAPWRDSTIKGLGIGNAYGEWQVIVWYLFMTIAVLIVGKISWFLFEETSVKLGKRVIKNINS